jgi:tetratricopeptide (TPR) repeat protein
LQSGQYVQAVDVGQQVITLARDMGDRHAEARIYGSLGVQMVNVAGKTAFGTKLLRRAAKLAIRLNDSSYLLIVLCDLAFAERIGGRATLARERCARAHALIDLHSELATARGDVLHEQAMTDIELGDWDAGLATLTQAISFKQNADASSEALFALRFNLSLVQTHLGQYEEACTIAHSNLDALDNVGTMASIESVWLWAVLAQTHLTFGQLDAAADALSHMTLPEESAGGGGRPLLYALTVLGQLYLAREAWTQAETVLARAVALWQMGRTVLIEPLLFHAMAAHRADHPVAAELSLQLAAEQLSRGDSVRFRPLFHYTRYIVLGEKDDLCKAYDELNRQANRISDVQRRKAFLRRPVLHREIVELWAQADVALQGMPLMEQVNLARIDAPLGKRLDARSYIDVRWTVDAGEEDAAVLRQEGSAALRQHRVRRLLREAHSQGAAPTDEDLARVLKVTRRTIERDMVALRQNGHNVAFTRRRFRENE